MAHQCWNDGTDRSTLPIHGTSSIGINILAPIAVSVEPDVFSADSEYLLAKANKALQRTPCAPVTLTFMRLQDPQVLSQDAWDASCVSI